METNSSKSGFGEVPLKHPPPPTGNINFRTPPTANGNSDVGDSNGVGGVKKTSFQITSVTVDSSASNDGGDDSGDELDESHTEDSSDIPTDFVSKCEGEVSGVPVPVNPDVEDFTKKDVFYNSAPLSSVTNAPVIPTSSQFGLAIVAENATSMCTLGGEPQPVPTTSSTAVQMNPVETQPVDKTHNENEKELVHNRLNRERNLNACRFKVVKIMSNEPFKKGRWVCMDYFDHTTTTAKDSNPTQTITQSTQAVASPSPGMLQNAPLELLSVGGGSHTHNHAQSMINVPINEQQNQPPHNQVQPNQPVVGGQQQQPQSMINVNLGGGGGVLNTQPHPHQPNMDQAKLQANGLPNGNEGSVYVNINHYEVQPGEGFGGQPAGQQPNPTQPQPPQQYYQQTQQSVISGLAGKHSTAQSSTIGSQQQQQQMQSSAGQPMVNHIQRTQPNPTQPPQQTQPQPQQLPQQPQGGGGATSTQGAQLGTPQSLPHGSGLGLAAGAATPPVSEGHTHPGQSLGHGHTHNLPPTAFLPPGQQGQPNPAPQYQPQQQHQPIQFSQQQPPQGMPGGQGQPGGPMGGGGDPPSQQQQQYQYANMGNIQMQHVQHQQVPTQPPPQQPPQGVYGQSAGSVMGQHPHPPIGNMQSAPSQMQQQPQQQQQPQGQQHHPQPQQQMMQPGLVQPHPTMIQQQQQQPNPTQQQPQPPQPHPQQHQILSQPQIVPQMIQNPQLMTSQMVSQAGIMPGQSTNQMSNTGPTMMQQNLPAHTNYQQAIGSQGGVIHQYSPQTQQQQSIQITHQQQSQQRQPQPQQAIVQGQVSGGSGGGAGGPPGQGQGPAGQGQPFGSQAQPPMQMQNYGMPNMHTIHPHSTQPQQSTHMSIGIQAAGVGSNQSHIPTQNELQSQPGVMVGGPSAAPQPNLPPQPQKMQTQENIIQQQQQQQQQQVPVASVVPQTTTVSSSSAMATLTAAANVIVEGVNSLVAENAPPPNDNEDNDNTTGTNTVAIDNKIEQAMDLVKSHLMFAVREEVEVLKEKIAELMDRIAQLEQENSILKAKASPETLAQLQQQQQQKPANQNAS